MSHSAHWMVIMEPLVMHYGTFGNAMKDFSDQLYIVCLIFIKNGGISFLRSVDQSALPVQPYLRS